MEVLAGMFLSGIVGFLLGKPRRREIEGLFAGFLLGPIGWLLIMVVRHAGPSCPFCTRMVDPAATRCPFCTSAIIPAANAVDSTATAAPDARPVVPEPLRRAQAAMQNLTSSSESGGTPEERERAASALADLGRHIQELRDRGEDVKSLDGRFAALQRIYDQMGQAERKQGP